MNEIETRIVKLAELIGISTENSSKELAELKGYAEGFANLAREVIYNEIIYNY